MNRDNCRRRAGRRILLHVTSDVVFQGIERDPRCARKSVQGRHVTICAVDGPRAYAG